MFTFWFKHTVCQLGRIRYELYPQNFFIRSQKQHINWARSCWNVSYAICEQQNCSATAGWVWAMSDHRDDRRSGKSGSDQGGRTSSGTSGSRSGQERAPARPGARGAGKSYRWVLVVVKEVGRDRSKASFKILSVENILYKYMVQGSHLPFQNRSFRGQFEKK